MRPSNSQPKYNDWTFYKRVDQQSLVYRKRLRYHVDRLWERDFPAMAERLKCNPDRESIWQALQSIHYQTAMDFFKDA